MPGLSACLGMARVGLSRHRVDWTALMGSADLNRYDSLTLAMLPGIARDLRMGKLVLWAANPRKLAIKFVVVAASFLVVQGTNSTFSQVLAFSTGFHS